MSVIVSVVGGSSVVSSKELVAAKGGKPVRIKAIRGGKYVLAEGEQRIGPENITVKRVGKNLLVALEGTKPEHAELIIEDFFGSEGQLVGLAEDGEYHEYIAVDGEQASAAAALYDGSTSPLALGTAVIGGIASALMAAPVGILPYVLAGLGVAAAGVAIERHNDDDSKPQPADTTPPENKGIGSVIDDKDGGRTELKDGASTNDDTPTLVGGGQEPGDTVTIIDNGKVIGEVIVDDKGQWSFTPEKGLGEGEHVLEVIVTDPAGNASKPSDDFTIIVDTTAPAKPVIGSVMDDQGAVVGPVARGGSTDDTLPTLNGTAEPGTVVHIYDNGRLLGSASVDGKGAWSFTPSTPLGEGEHVFTVTCSDAAGNTSPLSDGHLIVVDTSAPGKPNGADSMLWDDEGPVVGEIKPGDTTDDRTPTFSGKGEPGATVVIQDNGKEIGRVPVGDDGKWSFTPDTPLGDGAHSLDYYVVDGAGNAGQPSDPIEFVVDTSALSVRIDGVTDNVGSVTGPVVAGGVTDDATPTVHGSATPGATVEIHANGVLLGKTTVGADGKWRYTPAVALADGSYAIKAVVVAATGASQSSTEFVIEVDTTAPDKPSAEDATLMDDVGAVIGEILSGDTTDDTLPTFSGDAEEGATIVIYDDGTEIGRVVVGENGHWEFTPATALVEGVHSFSYEVMDRAGNVSERSDGIEFTVDTSDARVFIEGAVDNVGSKQGGLKSGSVTDDATPTLHGSGTVGGVVKIYDDLVLLGETTVGADGRWSFTPSHSLDEGVHNLRATLTTPAQGEGLPTGKFELLIDLTAPDKPSIGSVYDDQGEVTGNLTSGQVTDDAKPELKGTGEPNSTIIVKDNGVEIGRTPVDADGNWSFVPETPLLQGEHPLTVVNVDAAGNESQPSDAFVVNVGSSAAPAVPSVTGVIDDVGTVQGNLQKNAITDDARPTITGTAQPGMTISVYDNGKLLGTTQVDAKGEWSFTPTTALADGPHNLTAKATNAMGNSSPETGPYPIVVDTAAPAKPNSGDATLTDNEGSITGEIKPGDKTDDSTPTFAGKTEPGAEVVIHDNGKEIGRVTADPEGNWTFTPTTPLADGDHSLSYEVVDQAGNVSEPSDPLGFVVDTRDVTVRIDGATDNAGKVQGAISAGGVTDDATPTLHGQATPGGTVKIYDGGVLVGQTTADAEGKWSLELPAALAAGPHSLTATVTTAASGESAPTPPFTLTVDLSAPNKPVISSVEDDVGSVQGAIGQGKTTDDTTPTLKGTAEAGSTVHIYDNGSLLGSVVAGSNGVWGYTPTTPLNNGPHSFTVTSEDKAGNVSTPSDAYAVIVDTVPPGKPSIGSVYDDQGDVTGNLTSGQVTDDAKPELKGTAEPNSTIIVKDNGVEIGRAPVDAGGNWSFVPETPLLQGEHPLTVVNVDAAGNESLPSDAFVVNVGSSAAPAVPSVTGVIDDVGTVQGNLQKNAITDDARPTITGTAQPGMTISVYDNGKLLGTTQVDAKGEWSFTPTTALADGPHNLTAKATNAMGNSSPETGPYPIVVDTAAPAKPNSGDATLTDNEGSITGEIKPGDKTDDSTPTFAGKTEPGAEVVIHDNGKEIGRVTADPEGNWTFTPAPALVDGAHSMSYQVVDKAGNVGEESDPINFTLDSSAVTVRIEGATDNAGGVTGELANGGVTDDATPTLHGTATAGGTVKIYDGNNVLLGETIANAEGKWSFTPATPLPEGAVTLYATVTTGASEESEKTPAFDLILDMTAPLKPVIEKIEDDVGNPQGVLANGQSTDDTTPTLSGKAEAGSTVRIHDNGSLLGSVVVDGAGNWNFTPTTPLNNGPHSFTVTSVDPAGNVSVPSDAYVVTVDTVAPGKPVIGSVYDDQGGSTGNLVSGDETDDTRPELKGTGELNSTIIVKDNGMEIGRVPVDANGNWSFVPTAPLVDGEHPLTVVNVDAAGNESRPSDPFVVIVDGSGGGKPEITAVMDDQGPKQGLVNAGESTDDVKPQISGTAKPNSTVSIWDNNVKIGQVQSDAAGNWTFTPDAVLQEGSHSIHVTAVDALGSEAEPSAPFAFEVNTGTPETPRISNIRDDVGEYQGIQRSGGHTDDTRPTVTGTGKAGDTIEVRVDGVAIGRGVVGADGRWSVTSSFDIAEGLHMFTAVAVSPSGVESALSNSYELTIDTTPPESPVVITVTDNAGTWKGELENGDFTDDRTPT
ncbi:MAG: Ig-like domain-containing protein, partial [Stenotrophomonas sp.]